MRSQNIFNRKKSSCYFAQRFFSAFALLGIALLWSGTVSAETKNFQLREGANGNLILEQDRLALVSTVQILIKAGSMHDPAGKEGLTDLSLEVLLRGTQRLSRDEFAAAVERLGATVGSSTNSVNSTISLSVISENLEGAIALLGEALVRPGLRERDFAAVKKEKLGKLAQAKSRAGGLAARAARQKLYAGSAMAHFADGTIESIGRITLTDVKKQIRQMVAAGNVMVALDTNVDPAKAKSWLSSALEGLPSGGELPRPEIVKPAIAGRQLVIVNKPGLTTVNTFLVHPTISSDNPDLLPLELSSFVLGGGMSSRLFTVLRKNNGWTYGASSGFSMLESPRKFGGVYGLYTFPATEHAEKAIPKFVEVYEEFVSKGVTADEFRFARNSQVNSYAFNFVSASSRIYGRLYERLDGYPFLSVDAYREKMSKLNLNQLNAAIARAHDPKNFVLVVTGDPEKLRGLEKLIPGIASTTIMNDPIDALLTPRQSKL